MCTSFNVGIPKQKAVEFGGFDEDFIGWGFEDSFFGAMSISSGNYLVPCIEAVSFHIIHPDREDRQYWFQTNNAMFTKKLDEEYENIVRKNKENLNKVPKKVLSVRVFDVQN